MTRGFGVTGVRPILAPNRGLGDFFSSRPSQREVERGSVIIRVAPKCDAGFLLFESDHHAIRAKRQLQSLAPSIQFHGDAISVAQP